MPKASNLGSSSAPPVVTGVYTARPSGQLLAALPDAGVAIDPRSPYAVWANRYLTQLPYIPDERDPNKNALEMVSASGTLVCSLTHILFSLARISKG